MTEILNRIIKIKLNKMETGIAIDDNILTEFSAMRMNRTHRFIIFKINDGKTAIEIEKVGERESTFEHFKECMPKDQCRYYIKYPSANFVPYPIM